MIKKLFVLLLLCNFAFSKQITPNEVYSQVMLIKDNVEFLLQYYDTSYDTKNIEKRVHISSKLKPRNVWQKTYEILVKINVFRNEHGLPTIEPVNMAPILNLDPQLVYEQTQRILTELKIYKDRLGIRNIKFKAQTFKGKTPMDVFNGLSVLSVYMDLLNKGSFTPSFVFGENMRVYDDISTILEYLDIDDKTIPAVKNINATPTDTFNTGMQILQVIKQLQISVGIDFVDFSGFKKEKPTPSEVFGLTQMIISEMQTIKAYLGIDSITKPASKYQTKTPVEVDQLMSWNLRKLELIHKLTRI